MVQKPGQPPGMYKTSQIVGSTDGAVVKWRPTEYG